MIKESTWITLNGPSIRNSWIPKLDSADRKDSSARALNSTEENDTTPYASITQRRADAAVLMVENNLQSAGRDTAIADRYQVIVSVDAAELADSVQSNCLEHACSEQQVRAADIPPKRPTLTGSGSETGTTPIAKDTARRLACDCSLSTVVTRNAEPVDIGQKSRIWPVAMARVIKARDKQCVFPGCAQSRHLQIHPIKHWADGGSTRVDNAACLCAYHHMLLHERGLRIERVAGNADRLVQQFAQQTSDSHREKATAHVAEPEKRLRNSQHSFNAVRRVSPERYRLRLIDQKGRDISMTPDFNYADCIH